MIFWTVQRCYVRNGAKYDQSLQTGIASGLSIGTKITDLVQPGMVHSSGLQSERLPSLLLNGVEWAWHMCCEVTSFSA